MVSNHVMSTQQALEIAYSSIADRPYSTKAGNIIVEHSDGKFSVAFLFLSESGREEDHGLNVAVSESGEVLSISDAPASQQSNIQARAELRAFISAKKAYDLALESIKGFEDFDKPAD